MPQSAAILWKSFSFSLLYHICQKKDVSILFSYHDKWHVRIKGAIRRGAKGAEAPPLAKSTLRINIKYRIVLICFFCEVFQWSWSCVIWPIYDLKIGLRHSKTSSHIWRHKDYTTKNTSSKCRHKIFPFSSPSLSKVLVVLLHASSRI